MTDRSRKRIMYVAAALIALFSLFFAGKAVWDGLQRGDEAESGAELEVHLRPRLTATRVVGRRQGERQFELDAGSIGDEDDWVVLEDIENGLLYRDGTVFVSFQADAGRWHRPSNNLVLTGDVVLEYDGRVRLRTEEIEWRAEDEIVVAPLPVRMTVDGDEVTANSMEADLDSEKLHLEGDVLILRDGGDRVEMATVVYWLAEDRLEGFGRGRLVFGGKDD